MRKFFLILIIIFICGILSADICLKEIRESDVFIGVEFFQQYAMSKLVFRDVIWTVLYERIRMLTGVLLLCFTPIKKRLGIIVAPTFSFVWGFYLMSCIVSLGVAGLVVGLASVLPHGIFYGAVIRIMLHQGTVRKYHLKNQMIWTTGRGIFMFLLFITACVIETLVGVHFIPWVIRLSLI